MNSIDLESLATYVLVLHNRVELVAGEATVEFAAVAAGLPRSDGERVLSSQAL